MKPMDYFSKINEFIAQYPLWIQIIFLSGLVTLLVSTFLAIAFHPKVLKSEVQPQILVSRILNPLGGEKTQKVTAYLASEGNATFIIDSITVTHQKGKALSMGTGALPPDGRYVFPFRYGSSEIHALDPALVIRSQEHREVSLSVQLYPVGSFSSVGGSVSAILHYHLERTGESGTLLIRPPFRKGVELAKLIDRIVIVGEMAVTPEGLQRGITTISGDDVQYEPLKFPYVSLYPLKIPDPVPEPKLTSQRKALNRVILSRGVIPEIIELLGKGNPLAFDLCAGLGKVECDQALINLTSSPEKAEKAVSALATRHLFYPDDTLASTVLMANVAVGAFRSYVSGRHITTALLLFPRGSWVEALLRVAAHHDDAFAAIMVHRDKLSESERKMVEEASLSSLDELRPSSAALHYLVWRGHTISDIEERLKHIPVTEEEDVHAYRASRQYREAKLSELRRLDTE